LESLIAVQTAAGLITQQCDNDYVAWLELPIKKRGTKAILQYRRETNSGLQS
jgi:hypothetical protein